MSEISIIVPVYNAEAYLAQCLESILQQSYADYELILIDDGSSDSSGEICDSFAKRDSRISVLHQQNKGQSAARNRGVEYSKSDLLCFVDADDIVHPDFLQALRTAYYENAVNAAISARIKGIELPADFFLPKHPEVSLYSINEESLLGLFTKNDTLYWTLFPCLIKKSVYQKYPLSEGHIMEDNAVSCKWLLEAETVALVSPPLYFYRENPTGTMNASFSEKKLDYLWAIEEQLCFYEQNGFRELQKILAKHYVESAVWLARRVKTELNNKKLSHGVIRKAVRVHKKYMHTGCFTAAEDRKLFKAAHPFLHRIKKKLYICRTQTREG